MFNIHYTKCDLTIFAWYACKRQAVCRHQFSWGQQKNASFLFTRAFTRSIFTSVWSFQKTSIVIALVFHLNVKQKNETEMFQYSTQNSEYFQRWNCYVILQICNIRCQKFDPQHESVGSNKWEGFKANSWKKLQEFRANSIKQTTKFWKVFCKISRNDVKICWRGTQIDLPSFPCFARKRFKLR